MAELAKDLIKATPAELRDLVNRSRSGPEQKPEADLMARIEKVLEARIDTCRMQLGGEKSQPVAAVNNTRVKELEGQVGQLEAIRNELFPGAEKAATLRGLGLVRTVTAAPDAGTALALLPGKLRASLLMGVDLKGLTPAELALKLDGKFGATAQFKNGQSYGSYCMVSCSKQLPGPVLIQMSFIKEKLQGVDQSTETRRSFEGHLLVTMFADPSATLVNATFSRDVSVYSTDTDNGQLGHGFSTTKYSFTPAGIGALLRVEKATLPYPQNPDFTPRYPFWSAAFLDSTLFGGKHFHIAFAKLGLGIGGEAPAHSDMKALVLSGDLGKLIEANMTGSDIGILNHRGTSVPLSPVGQTRKN